MELPVDYDFLFNIDEWNELIVIQLITQDRSDDFKRDFETLFYNSIHAGVIKYRTPDSVEWIRDSSTFYRFAPSAVITWALAKGLDLPAELIAWHSLQSNAPEPHFHHITPNPNKSKQLASLNLGCTKFWANADRDDKTTWPNTKDIIAWLVEGGFTQSLAQSGATIIRPEWAGSGRR